MHRRCTDRAPRSHRCRLALVSLYRLHRSGIAASSLVHRACIVAASSLRRSCITLPSCAYRAQRTVASLCTRCCTVRSSCAHSACITCAPLPHVHSACRDVATHSHRLCILIVACLLAMEHRVRAAHNFRHTDGTDYIVGAASARLSRATRHSQYPCMQRRRSNPKLLSEPLLCLARCKGDSLLLPWAYRLLLTTQVHSLLLQAAPLLIANIGDCERFRELSCLCACASSMTSPTNVHVS